MGPTVDFCTYPIFPNHGPVPAKGAPASPCPLPYSWQFFIPGPGFLALIPAWRQVQFLKERPVDPCSLLWRPAVQILPSAEFSLLGYDSVASR